MAGTVPVSGAVYIKDTGPQFKTECDVNGAPFPTLQLAHSAWPYRGIGHKRRVLNGQTGKVDTYEYVGETEVENTDITNLVKNSSSQEEIEALFYDYLIPSYRAIAFDRMPGGGGYGGRFYLAGKSPKGFTMRLPFTYTPPDTTSLSDVCLWKGNDGNLYGVHSGYVGPNNGYVGNSLVVFRGPIVTTPYERTDFKVIAVIDMTNRITETIGGYTGIGPNPIVSSGEYRDAGNGKVGLFFMYQANFLSSDSHTMYIESTDNACTDWGNAKLVTGAALTWGQGDYATGKMGSAIDPSYYFVNGLHLLVERIFSTGNNAPTGLGLSIYVSTTSHLSGYDEVYCNLKTIAKGGTNPYITEHHEGAALHFNINGQTLLTVDHSGIGESQYCVIQNDEIYNPLAYGPFINIKGPNNSKTGHHTALKIPNVLNL